MNTHWTGHTDRDVAALGETAAARTQPREHQVRCFCGTKTSHQAGFCDAHYQPPAQCQTKVSV